MLAHRLNNLANKIIVFWEIIKEQEIDQLQFNQNIKVEMLEWELKFLNYRIKKVLIVGIKRNIQGISKNLS